MNNQAATNLSNQNDDYVKSSQAEMQRRFVYIQFKRSELEKQLKIVNEVLFFFVEKWSSTFHIINFINKVKVLRSFL